MAARRERDGEGDSIEEVRGDRREEVEMRRKRVVTSSGERERRERRGRRVGSERAGQELGFEEEARDWMSETIWDRVSLLSSSSSTSRSAMARVSVSLSSVSEEFGICGGSGNFEKKKKFRFRSSLITCYTCRERSAARVRAGSVKEKGRIRLIS